MFLTCVTLTTGILTWIKGTCCICMVKIGILPEGCQIVQFGNTKVRILFLQRMVAHILIAVKNIKKIHFLKDMKLKKCFCFTIDMPNAQNIA